MKMMKRIRVIIGICFLMAGVCYFFYPNYKEWQTQREVDHIISVFKTEKEKMSKTEKGKAKNTKKATTTGLYNAFLDYNKQLATSGQHIVDAWSYEQPPVDINLLNNGNSAIGYIEIPDIQVRLPLYLGASLENLAKGATVMSQTSMPIGGENTNCVIAGHRGYRGEAFFHYINELNIGSKVYITNPWETLVYKVVETKIIMPDQIEDVMIQKGKDMVTLVSCHPYAIGGGAKRYLVYCERDYSVQEENSKFKSIDSNLNNIQGNELQWLERILRNVVPFGILLLGIVLLLKRKK